MKIHILRYFHDIQRSVHFSFRIDFSHVQPLFFVQLPSCCLAKSCYSLVNHAELLTIGCYPFLSVFISACRFPLATESKVLDCISTNDWFLSCYSLVNHAE
jgi:hypothetical protein